MLHQQHSKPKNTKLGTERLPIFLVVRAQSPLGNPKPPKQQAGLRRVESIARERPTPSPTISVVVTHAVVSGNIEMIPVTGAAVIGLQYLKSLGLSKSNLDPPPTLAYYDADGFKMPAVSGSFQAELFVLAPIGSTYRASWVHLCYSRSIAETWA